MKFLVRSDVPVHVSGKRPAELFRRTRDQVGRGDTGVTVEAVYGILGGRGAIAICDTPDAETLHAFLTAAPLFHFERFSVTPLVSFDAFLDGMINAAVAANGED